MIVGVVHVQFTARVAYIEYVAALARITLARTVFRININHAISVSTTVYAHDAA